MNIQAYFDNQALDMLKETSAYISQSYRAGHHRSVIIEKINNSVTTLNSMTQRQLDDFDSDCLNYLKEIDNNNNETKGSIR